MLKQGLVAAVLAWLILAGPAAAQEAGAPPPEVGVITASQEPVYAEQSYVGRIQSPQIVQLQARVTGFLEQQNFTDGDQVKKGQLLYVIEQAPYAAAVEQAKATLEGAMAQAHNATINLKRAQALLDTPAGQQSTVDSSQAAAVSGSAQIDSARAQLETAQINYSYTQILSPIDGQIGATSVNTGNVVGPNSGTLATIVAEDPMYVSFALPVVDALQFRQTTSGPDGLNALELLVQLPDGRMYGQTGTLNFINNQVTANTDTLTWRGTIPNPVITGTMRELTDGEFVSVTLRKKTPENQLIIPRDAVITDQLGDYVLKIGPNNTAIRQPVTMGAQTNTNVQILQGLNPGDQVVVDGIQRIHPGIIVNPQPADKS